MSDIEAIQILSGHVKKFKQLPSPPESIDEVDTYKTAVQRTLDGAKTGVQEVNTYVVNIEAKLQELRMAQKTIIDANRNAIKRIIGGLKPEYDRRGNVIVPSQLDKLKLAHQLEELTLGIMKSKLGELIQETEVACAKYKDGALLTMEDIGNLDTCWQAWENAKVDDAKKKKDDEEARRKAEEERKQREKEQREKEEAERKAEEERKRREEEERKAEEERRRKEEEREAEEERKRREEEERKAEEERKRREEEERKAEEERKRREEEERKAEEERKRREEEERKAEEERKRREEEARKRREEKERRAEEERKRKKEEEERLRRQNPENWKPLTIHRDEVAGKKADSGSKYQGEVGGRKAYHGDINCVVLSPSDSITEDNIECNYSDEVDSIIETLEIGEKPLSSIVDIKSRNGVIQTEVPSRVYIPYNTSATVGDEIVVKVSINGMDWTTTQPIATTANMSEEQKLARGLVGIEVNDFESLKIIVTARPRCQHLIVDNPGISVTSTVDKNVKLFVPRSAFPSKTEVKLTVKSTTEETLNGFKKDNSSIENVFAVNFFITLSSAKSPQKSIEFDLKQSNKSKRLQRGKTYQLQATKDNTWRHADVEYKGTGDDVTVSLPKGIDRHMIMELEVSTGFPRDNVPKLAETLCSCINSAVVRMIVKRHENNLSECVLMVVRNEEIQDAISDLAVCGYTQGPPQTAEFNVTEGQLLGITIIGNIEIANEAEKEQQFHYMSYLGGVATDLTLAVKDIWKQKDLPSYTGSLQCTVYKEGGPSGKVPERTVELTVYLPKLERPKTTIDTARVKCPYFLMSLTYFLSKRLCEDGTEDWRGVLKTILGPRKFESGYRIAKRKSADTNDTPICRAMFVDWMKTQEIQMDKVSPIMTALHQNGYAELASVCKEFVDFQKEHLSDEMMSNLTDKVTKDVRVLGNELGLSKDQIELCTERNEGSVREQVIAILKEWRETETASKYEFKALEYLKSICV